MYRIMALISVLVRQFVLPNPFEQLPKAVSVTLSGVEIAVPSALLNWLVEPLLYAITFGLVGLYYTRRRDPAAKGSFLYLLFYCIHVALLTLLSQFQFSALSMIIVVGGYALLHIGFAIVKNQFCVNFINIQFPL